LVKPTFADTLDWSNHPLIKLQQQEEKAALASTKLERSKLLPEFNIGYNNTSLRDDINFDQDDRFQSFQLGLTIPLFGGAQHNKIKSAQIYQEFRKSETANATKQISTNLNSAYIKYQQQLLLIESLEKDGLRTAQEISSTLNSQLKNGEINYLEWTMLNNEVLNIRESYFETIQQLNKSIIELNYLLAQQ